MPELSNIERIQPCLLDRLTDSAPDNELESRSERVMSASRYREAVLRDIRWLFTTAQPDLDDVSEEFPDIATSVLNFGSWNLCGRSSDSVGLGDVERHMRDMLIAFEPRMNPDSVTVKGVRVRDYRGHMTNELTFDIRGELWANPTPEELFIKTKLDLETGNCELQESRAP